MSIVHNSVSPRYFETMRIPLVAGREFSPQDSTENERVLIVNETMARRYWSDRDAVGGQVRTGQRTYRVVGVARDIKYQSLNERSSSHMYFALEQNYASDVTLQVRVAGDAAGTLASIRETVRGLDATLPLADVRPVTEHMVTAVFAQKIGANLLGIVGGLALFLAAIGLYGVMSYAVGQRTRELGVRLALGAKPRDLLRMVVGQGLMLAAIGLGFGLVAAYGLTGLMRSLLPGITPHDPLTFVAVPVLLVAIALVAAWIPARRASTVDPVVALRHE
jgi:predicted permease